MNSPNDASWRYLCYPSNLPAGQFGPFESFVELWRGKIKDNRLPTWRDFKFEEFEEWWGHLSLADTLNDPFDLEFRLWGTKITDWWGIDYTKKKMADTYEGRKENWEYYEGPYFQRLIEHQEIGVCGGPLKLLDRPFINVQSIDLLLTKDGEIAQILSCYVKFESGSMTFPVSNQVTVI